MAITAISRDWGVDPCIVRITDDAVLATITTSGYVLTQDTNIQALQNGSFEWVDGDEILIYFADGQGFFTYDSATGSFVAQPAAAGTLTDTLANTHIFVGNGANIATGVAMSGDATMANTGALTIANLAVTTAKLNNNAVTSAKAALNLVQYTTVAVTAAEFNGMYAAPKLLLAAGGANTLIVLERAILAMTFVSADYAAGGVVGIQYDSTVHGAGTPASTTEAAADFFAGASTAFQLNGVSGDTVGASPFSSSVNKGLYLSNLTQAFTTGDSTFVVHLWYKIIPTV